MLWEVWLYVWLFYCLKRVEERFEEALNIMKQRGLAKEHSH